MQTSFMLIRKYAKVPPVGSRLFLVGGIMAVWLGIDYLLTLGLQIRDDGHGIT